MDIKINAVMLRAVDYGENDKILTLFTAERGKISAGIRGVKKPNAKLRFASQPFCFGEYILAERGSKHTVINCSEIESFYDLRADINKFYAASAVLEAVYALSYEGEESGELFYACVKALTEMCAGDERSALIKFLLFALERSGYAISAKGCNVCGANLLHEEKTRFDMDAGTFTCFACGTGFGASRSTYNELRRALGMDCATEYLEADGQKRALKLIKEYFTYKTDSPIKSLSEYIRLI